MRGGATLRFSPAAFESMLVVVFRPALNAVQLPALLDQQQGGHPAFRATSSREIGSGSKEGTAAPESEAGLHSPTPAPTSSGSGTAVAG